MEFSRSSGILLHPTSLPGRCGIGDLGAGAYAFVDWLVDAGQSVWQVLPLGPTGYGDSPYQCFSAFAGNPLLIDLDDLVHSKWLSESASPAETDFSADRVEYEAVMRAKLPLLAQAAREFTAHGGAAEREDFADFCTRHADWLDDFALFMAVKDAHRGAAWTFWERPIARHEPRTLAHWREQFPEQITAHKFTQWVFFRQWESLRSYCRERGVRILGDLPIYVAHDSSDVWADPELFQLDESGNPEFVAGVPPDYFSADGQLWGNPLYRWDAIARRGFGWWIARLQAALGLFNMLRLDHFRGFEAYWKVPASEHTAINGEWIKGPGATFFEAVQAALGPLPIIAENLGVITPEVEALRNRFDYPGMAILQFAFGKDPQGPAFRPHNYEPHRVAYTGTHDNDTTLGWWLSSGAAGSTRSEEDVRKEREFARLYLNTTGGEMNWVLIRTVLASVAGMALFPLQDVLGLGSEARMNIPARPSGNWRWRFRREMLTPDLSRRLGELTRTYDR